MKILLYSEYKVIIFYTMVLRPLTCMRYQYLFPYSNFFFFVAIFSSLFFSHHSNFNFIVTVSSVQKQKKKREKALIYASVLRKICDTLLGKHYASMKHKRLHKGVCKPLPTFFFSYFWNGNEKIGCIYFYLGSFKVRVAKRK